MSQMSSVTEWERLLGLPLDRALLQTEAAGVACEVARTVASRREPAADTTLRVIRVRAAQDGLQLTVSPFVDGDPRKA